MSIPRRIVRFYASSDDSKSDCDESQSFYGILDDDQQAKVGTTVSILNTDNIYDTSRYHLYHPLLYKYLNI